MGIMGRPDGDVKYASGGITADADLSQTSLDSAISAGETARVKPACLRVGLFFRVPLQTTCNLLHDQKYDCRDAESLTEAEIHGENRPGPICKHSPRYPVRDMRTPSNGPEIAHRESRHVNARYQVTTQDIETERASTMWCAGGVAD